MRWGKKTQISFKKIDYYKELNLFYHKSPLEIVIVSFISIKEMIES